MATFHFCLPAEKKCKKWGKVANKFRENIVKTGKTGGFCKIR